MAAPHVFVAVSCASVTELAVPALVTHQQHRMPEHSFRRWRNVWTLNREEVEAHGIDENAKASGTGGSTDGLRQLSIETASFIVA